VYRKEQQQQQDYRDDISLDPTSDVTMAVLLKACKVRAAESLVKCVWFFFLFFSDVCVHLCMCVYVCVHLCMCVYMCECVCACVSE